MDDLHNTIRNRIQEYCLEHNFSFFNLYANEGFMRSLIFRNNPQGQWMLIVVFGHEDAEKRKALLEFIKNTFPQISSLVYIINEKLNDTINDLETQVYSGDAFLIQQLEDLKFKIGPKSFFQTNTLQTQKLYETARTFAQLSGNENVYDLYTGVGTIALFVAKQAKHVTGIEYVPEAIVDADMNAAFNGIANTSFFAGDMKQVLNDSLIQKEGKPDVIITDPPRAGMHEDVVKKIMELLPARIVYVSCNPATQARDIALMTELYKVTRVQPVDMFPHTHHVECVTLLERK
jgi:23S rRNA (uracil1939-C5)-methyltransferase